MKNILITILFLASPLLFANTELEKQIAEACNRHALSLAGQIQNDIVPGMTNDKAKQTFQVAEQSCLAYFNKTFINNESAIEIAEAEKVRKEREGETVIDTLERVLSEEPTRKEGNKRLMRKK